MKFSWRLVLVPHLDKNIEGQAVDVVDVAQAEQAGEQATAQHAHRQVQPDGQAFPNDAAAGVHGDDITISSPHVPNQHLCWDSSQVPLDMAITITYCMWLYVAKETTW